MTEGSTTSLPRLAEIGVDRLNRRRAQAREALHAIGIDSVLDLITHYPRRYVDRTNQADIADLVDGQEAMVLGTVRRSSSPADPAGASPGRGGPVRRIELLVGHVLQPAVAAPSS